MPDPFESPKLRLVWAKKNLFDLERQRDRFNDEEPWSSVVETNANGSAKEYKIVFTQPFPDVFNQITTYAIGDLRAVLDHAACATARCAGIIDPKNAHFPFGDTCNGLGRSIKGGGSKDVPADILARMCQFKPYRTGNDLLWAINRTANLDKHVIVSPMGVTLDSLIFGGPESAERPLVPFPPIWRRDKNEIVYAICHPSSNPNSNIHIKIEIAFDEIEVIKGLPVIRVLNAMISEVESVLIAIEAETRRLFPNAFL